MTKNATPTQVCIQRAESMQIARFQISKLPVRRDVLLTSLEQDIGFLDFMGNHCGIYNMTRIGKGGFGLVCSCTRVPGTGTEENSLPKSVIKLSSYRCLAAIDGGQKELPDINADFKFRVQLNNYCIRESYAYDLLSTEQRNQLVIPFVIAICYQCEETGAEKIYDYVFGLNIPLYQKVEAVLPEKCTEEEVLQIAYDVLEQLTTVHNEGVRHRDIKLENIMYDAQTKKYLLIDWGASSRAAEGGGIIENPNPRGGYTPVYADPLRFHKELKEANGVTVDLYSLSVFMAYMLHPKGYAAKNDIEKFHQAVCPGHLVEGNPVLNAAEIYNLLITAGGGSDHCTQIRKDVSNIIHKGMNHTSGYQNAQSMQDEVKKCLGIKDPSDVSREEKKPKKKKADKIVLPPLLGIVPCILVALYTLAHSGMPGMNSVIAGKETLWLTYVSAIACVFLPFLMIRFDFQNRGQKLVLKKTVLVEGILFILTTFLLMSTRNVSAMGSLRLPYPFGFDCIHLMTAWLTFLLAENWIEGIGRILGCTVSGLISGFLMVPCLGAELSECWNIVITMGIVGLIWGSIFSLCAFTYKTRLIRKK